MATNTPKTCPLFAALAPLCSREPGTGLLYDFKDAQNRVEDFLTFLILLHYANVQSDEKILHSCAAMMEEKHEALKKAVENMLEVAKKLRDAVVDCQVTGETCV